MSKDVKITKNTSHRCPFCTSNFCLKGSAYKHIERQHPEKYDKEIHSI